MQSHKFVRRMSQIVIFRVFMYCIFPGSAVRARYLIPCSQCEWCIDTVFTPWRRYWWVLSSEVITPGAIDSSLINTIECFRHTWNRCAWIKLTISALRGSGGSSFDINNNCIQLYTRLKYSTISFDASRVFMEDRANASHFWLETTVGCTNITIFSTQSYVPN